MSSIQNHTNLHSHNPFPDIISNKKMHLNVQIVFLSLFVLKMYLFYFNFYFCCPNEIVIKHVVLEDASGTRKSNIEIPRILIASCSQTEWFGCQLIHNTLLLPITLIAVDIVYYICIYMVQLNSNHI